METHKLYKHKNNTDVAFCPFDIVDDLGKDEDIVMKGMWLNIVHGNPTAIVIDTIFIKPNDLENWELYEW